MLHDGVQGLGEYHRGPQILAPTCGAIVRILGADYQLRIGSRIPHNRPLEVIVPHLLELLGHICALDRVPRLGCLLLPALPLRLLHLPVQLLRLSAVQHLHVALHLLVLRHICFRQDLLHAISLPLILGIILPRGGSPGGRALVEASLRFKLPLQLRLVELGGHAQSRAAALGLFEEHASPAKSHGWDLQHASARILSELL
mmetsp:Transcript_7126/g.24680  ORF Transcript_7126/g.24680 Transcript_7126/m.24680 type:complete len:201 (-) Transcript_7126:1129-1731(-)